MISYLQGKIIETIAHQGNKVVLILEVGFIGYEIYITSRLAKQISINDVREIKIFTHLQIREDKSVLYGFDSMASRDLFRELINVSGIGSQLALALIDTLGLEELVQAIVTGNIRTLSKTPGVGQKTAERIALELKTKLSQWRKVAGINLAPVPINSHPEILEDVELTLLALGYTKEEIEQAIHLLSQDAQLIKDKRVEEWIKRAIAALS